MENEGRQWVWNHGCAIATPGTPAALHLAAGMVAGADGLVSVLVAA